jgi:prephenate dehydratase
MTTDRRSQFQVPSKGLVSFSHLTKLLLDVFDSVQSGEAALGVVPFENSTNGAVVFTLELLADRHNRYPDITVCGEAYLDVSHCFLGKKCAASTTDSPVMSGACTPTMSTPAPLKPRTSPLHSVKHVKRILSHPQAFGQCETFLSAYLKGVERIDVSSTSRAAEMVKEDTTGTSAAIASKLAAEIHDIDILAQGIEDREDNTTRPRPSSRLQLIIARRALSHLCFNAFKPLLSI